MNVLSRIGICVLMIGLAVVCLLGLETIAAAQSCVISDDFADNTPAGIWTHSVSPGSSVQIGEHYGRINFAGSTNSGYNDLAGGWSSGWELDMTQDWAFSATWNCTPPQPTGYYSGDIGIAVAVMLDADPENVALNYGMSMSTGLYHEYYWDGYNYYNYDIRYQVLAEWNYGIQTTLEFDEYFSLTSGTTYIWYDESLDRLYANDHWGLSGAWSFNNFQAGGSGQSTAMVAYAVYSFGDVPAFGWNRLFGDNFCILEGAVVGPSVGACCTADTCWDTIEHSCDSEWQGAGSTCESASGCVGDVDGSGYVGSDDVFTLLDRWGQSSTCQEVADLDASGAVGVHDLLIVLEHWGSC